MAALRENVKRCLSCASAFPAWAKGGSYGFAKFHQSSIGEDERDNVRVHRGAGEINVSKSSVAGVFVWNVLLSRGLQVWQPTQHVSIRLIFCIVSIVRIQQSMVQQCVSPYDVTVRIEVS